MRLLAGLAVAAILAGTAIAAPGDPKRRFTPADQERARSAVLKASDLPGSGWAGESHDFETPNPPCAVKNYSFEDLTVSGQAGTDFTRVGGDSAGSGVQVFPTKRQARTSWQRFLRPGYFLCIARGYADALERSTTRGQVSVAAVTRRPPPLPAATFGVRMLFRLSLGAQSVRMYLDLVEIVRGRIISGVGLTRLSSPWPDAVQRALVRKAAAKIPAT